MFDEKQIKNAAKKLDDDFDFVAIAGKNWAGKLLEASDNFIFEKGLLLLNKKYSDKIPEKYINNVNDTLLAYIEGDYKKIQAAGTEAIDETFDISWLEDDDEAVFIAINLDAIIKFIKYLAKKKNKV